MRKNLRIERLAVLCGVVCFSLISGCTTRGAYEAVRQGARNECYRKPSEPERDSCLARTQDGFDEYTRKRNAAARGEQE